jgi:hypothetical protein
MGSGSGFEMAGIHTKRWHAAKPLAFYFTSKHVDIPT